MITPELQQLAAQRAAGEKITVPDEQSVALVEADGAEPGMDLDSLLRIADELGEAGLTDEELEFVRASSGKREPGQAAEDHYANLAEHLEENALQNIAQRVMDWVQWDEESRADWYEMEKRGIRALGVSKNTDCIAPFEGASTATHPVLAEACVQFQSRALEQLWPAGGPAKTVVMGRVTPETQEQAKRVEQYLNYQYTELMPGAFEQTDAMLIRLPLTGSLFVKPFYDPVNGLTRGLVEPADFIVPYRSNDLRTAPRYTERIMLTPNEMRKRQVAKMYRDIELAEPNEDSKSDTDREVVIDEIRATEGRDEANRSSDDHRHTVLECYCELDLPGMEDKGKDGQPTGIALPYIVTVDHDSQKVLSIYRNWKPQDPQKKRVVYHVHYRFMPGFGFYGYGLYHWIGGLGDAVTGALRALLDSAQFSNLQGGLRAKDAKMPNGKLSIAPGEWKEIDTDAEDIRKAFYPLPYKEPSSVLFQLMGYLETVGRRFAGTTQEMVGEGTTNVPVGTTLARIEQGGKVLSAIQKRLHEAARQEFRLVAWLNSQWMPDEYPYAVEGDERAALRTDFDDRVDVIPVSDPNFVSNAQRYFASQAMLELAAGAPDLYDRRELHRRALMALRADDIDALMPDPGKHVKRRDPVTENALVQTGAPIKAFPEQAHEAHAMVHQQMLMGMDPKSPAAAVLDAHIREHMAMAYLQQMSQAIGVPLQMPEQDGEELPPEVENQIAMAAAQAAQQMQAEPPPDPKMIEVEREQARKDQLAQADVARKDATAKADVDRKDAVAEADIRRDNVLAIADQQRQATEPAVSGW
jgi:chaperonin GroES